MATKTDTKKLDTSITDTKAGRFLADAAARDTLWCTKITGFHLLKTTTGGSWRYRYQDAAGKRRVATVGRYPAMKPQQAAERALSWRNNDVDVLATREQERREAAQAAAMEKHRTLSAYLDGPYARHQQRKRTGGETLAIIRHNFADWLDRDMAGLTRSDVLEWQEAREAEGRAHVTLQRAFGAVKTLLKHATRQDPPILKVNPLERVTLERPLHSERDEERNAERAAKRRMLTGAEIQALHAGLDAFAEKKRAMRRNSRRHGKGDLLDLDAVTYPHWFIPFCYCGLHTGLRPGDLRTLTWAELNVTFGRLVKTPEKTKDNPDPARITMDLPADLLAIMRAWHAQQGKPQSGLVFPSPKTGRTMNKKTYCDPWAEVKQLGGLAGALDFYALRHHFISTLVAAGVPLFTVARLVGHKGTTMIEKHYGHLCPAAAAGALEILSRTVARSADHSAETTVRLLPEPSTSSA